MVWVLIVFVAFALSNTARGVTISTATGAGADAELNENPTGFDGGNGTGTAVNARFSNVDRNEWIALRFDLSGYTPSAVTNASLSLINFRTNSALTLRFFGVSPGTTGKDANGVVRGYSAENWDESDIRFSTMPGLDWDGNVLTRSGDLPNPIDLGTMLQTQINEGTSVHFSNAAVTAFLRSLPTNVVTFLVMRESTNSGQARFASKEAASTASGVLTGAVGDFAPRLVFDLDTAVASPTPAFPGAEGAGKFARGGRGGDVYYVTSLGDANTLGTLRYGINTAPAGGRSILFKVSGNIVLNSTLTVNRPRITIAGQTAPGDGICIQNYSFNIAANDVVLRHLRTRLGTNALQEADAMWINSGTNVIVDHLSASWSVDETLSASRTVANLTVQNCFITESLRNSIHEKGAHGYGGIISSLNTATYSYHHNLYAHHDSRNPRLGADSPAVVPRLDFRNNVVYGWGFRAGYSGGETENNELNYINNYVIAGPTSTSVNSAFLGGSANTAIHQSGNLIDSNKDGVLNGIDTGWSMITGAYTPQGAAFSVPEVTTDSAGTAYQKVVSMSGAMPWRRDAYDQRIARNVRRQGGQIIDFVSAVPFAGEYVTNNISGTNYVGVNPWPALVSESAPADLDGDGMPDFWELANGLQINNAADRNLTNALGYTRLEEYLNWRADPHAMSPRNGFVDVDLRRFVGGATNLEFAVVNPVNGSVGLLSDGFTARFVATNNFSGLARFSFNVVEPVNGLGFGPVQVGVLVTTTNAPNTPPVLAPVSEGEILAGGTLTITNSASDSDLPAQALSYSLLDAPDGADIDADEGVFTWRPLIAQGGGSHGVKVVVTDSGTPALSATQTFQVQVNLPANPAIQVSSAAGGQIELQVNGDAGPDYRIQASTNLSNWMDVTNVASPILPFSWTDTTAPSLNQRFYRIQLGP